MSSKNSVKAIPLTFIQSSVIDDTYSLIDANGLPNACFLLKIINNSNEDVTVSYDGDTDQEYVPKNTIATINAQTNAGPNSFVTLFPVGMGIYVKGTAGTGDVYLAGYYVPQN